MTLPRRPGRRARGHTVPASIDPAAWIQRVKAARLRPGCVAAAQGLAVYADFRAGLGLYPTTVYVAKGSQHIRRLRKDGWLTVMSRASGAGVYALVLPD